MQQDKEFKKLIDAYKVTGLSQSQNAIANSKVYMSLDFMSEDVQFFSDLKTKQVSYKEGLMEQIKDEGADFALKQYSMAKKMVDNDKDLNQAQIYLKDAMSFDEQNENYKNLSQALQLKLSNNPGEITEPSQDIMESVTEPTKDEVVTKS